MYLLRRHAKSLALLLAIGAFALVLVAVVLTHWLALLPCHLCIFQRVLHLAVGAALLAAWASWNGKLIPLISLIQTVAFSVTGLIAAGYQVWLQWQPLSSLGCGVGQQGWIERFVEMLSDWIPTLFMAGGLCEDDDLLILGLSIAVWSFLAFAGFLVSSVTLLIVRQQK